MKITITESPKPPREIYLLRILGMMQDYNLSLGEAIYWDMDGFPPPPSDDGDLDTEALYYFMMNQIRGSMLEYLMGVIHGTVEDLGIAENPQAKTNEEPGESPEGA